MTSDGSGRVTMLASCAVCGRGWCHCHGTWIVDLDGEWCSDDPDCDVPPEAHDHVVHIEEWL